MPVASKLVDVCWVFARNFTDDYVEMVAPVMFTTNYAKPLFLRA
jgi:hypothetical protein